MTRYCKGTTGAVSSTVYDKRGNPTKIADPDGYAIGFIYYEADRPLRAYDAEGNQLPGRTVVRSFPPLPSRTVMFAESKSMSLIRKVQHSSTLSPDPNIKRAIRAVEPDICTKTAETSPGVITTGIRWRC